MGIKLKDDNAGNGLHNALATGTTVTGDIHTEGDFRLDGRVEGNINSGAKIVIGPKGYIKGNITAANAEILGTVVGHITTGNNLILKASAHVEGDIFTQMLEIEPNARFTGVCNMAGKSGKAD